jgi:hypothetical protein
MHNAQRWIAENLGCLTLLALVVVIAVAVLFAVALSGLS